MNSPSMKQERQKGEAPDDWNSSRASMVRSTYKAELMEQVTTGPAAIQQPPSSPTFDQDRALAQHRVSVARLQCRLVQTVAPILAAAHQLAELQAITRALQQGITFERQAGKDRLAKTLTEACPMWQFAERDDAQWDGGLCVLADLLRVANEEAGDIASELEKCG